MSLAAVIHKLRSKENLSVNETRDVFNAIFVGAVPEDHIAAFLLALHRKGETTEEIRGAALSMRDKALNISAPRDAIDIVGTGGDAHGTYNISTAAALVTAACGVPVAKHGNRAATSKSGASDVLMALGVNLEPPLEILGECLHEAKICFLFAPRHHPAMRFVAPIRKKLGIRTIFNLLGPLTNPAEVKHHLIGVFSKTWSQPLAEALDAMGSTKAWITGGRDGMDEITTTTKTDVISLDDGTISAFAIAPDDAGLPSALMRDLQGGDAVANATALKALLAGEKNAYRDIVVINAAAALIVADKAPTLKHGAEMACEAIDSGAAGHVLETLVHITNKVPYEKRRP